MLHSTSIARDSTPPRSPSAMAGPRNLDPELYCMPGPYTPLQTVIVVLHFLQMRKWRRLREVESFALSHTVSVRTVWGFCLIHPGLPYSRGWGLALGCMLQCESLGLAVLSPWAKLCQSSSMSWVVFWVPQLECGGEGKAVSFYWMGLALRALHALALGRLPGLQLCTSSPTLNCS